MDLVYKTVLETTVGLIQLFIEVVQQTTDRIAVEVSLCKDPQDVRRDVDFEKAYK